MKTVTFTKSNADKCRRRIVISEINKLHNLTENHLRQQKIVRELGKLHSLWFKGISKDMRIAQLEVNQQLYY